MMHRQSLPLILVVDDLFGRSIADHRNEERANLCGQFLLEDVTGDENKADRQQKIKQPIAKAVFLRGQRPHRAIIGDTVENDLAGTLKAIHDGWSVRGQNQPRWAMVLLDLCFYTGLVTETSNRSCAGMPQGNPGDDDPSQYFGLILLKAIHEEFPDLPVVILSSQPREDVKHAYSTYGAYAFLDRSEADGADLLKNLLWRHGLVADGGGVIVGQSKSMLLALRAARRSALNENKPHLLIRGEQGVGKELLAEYIHRQSAVRREKPFVVVNSAILTPDLFASELFGIKRRVATGVDERIGYIRGANGGDVFFDEIKDMVPQAQAGILRVLEESLMAPVGSSQFEKVDVRFLSATNADIESLAAIGQFRGDLLERLRAGGTLILPPLRERKEDIPDLVKLFMEQAENANTGSLSHEIDPSVFDKLMGYDWPGNIRELRNCIFQAVNANPDVEFLVPAHIKLPNSGTEKNPNHKRPLPDTAERRMESARSASAIDEIISALSGCEFDSSRPAELVGRLKDLERAIARLMAKYLKAALIATSQPTPEYPDGKIYIHPAVKLITGDSKISASKAADIIKRLLNQSPDSNKEVCSERTLLEAFETAKRLRPSNPKRKKER